MLILHINRKPYMGSRMAPSHLTLGDLERSNSRSPTFRSLISHKRAYLGPMLLLNSNRKPCMASLMPPLDLTLSNLESQSQSHSDFEYQHICMVYIYLPAAYYHLNLDVTKENLLAAGFFPRSQWSFLLLLQ